MSSCASSCPRRAMRPSASSGRSSRAPRSSTHAPERSGTERDRERVGQVEARTEARVAVVALEAPERAGQDLARAGGKGRRREVERAREHAARAARLRRQAEERAAADAAEAVPERELHGVPPVEEEARLVRREL